MQAIENFAELGSGLHIMQTWTRGQELLGAEQSGFIADLGYETHRKILNEHAGATKEFADMYDDRRENGSDGEALLWRVLRKVILN